MTIAESTASGHDAVVPAVRMRDLGWLDWVTLAFPRFLGGFTFPDWLRMLGDQCWQVDAVFLPRSVLATLGAAMTSLVKPLDDACRMDSRDDAAWRRPTFILGHGRSGTTHLFNLLARDPRFAHATHLEVFNPHTFITLRRLGLQHVLRMLPTRRRAMDDVRVGWLSPAEDSIALTVLGCQGGKLQSIFPRTAAPEELAAEPFRAALAAFTRKLVHVHHRPLLLKSPEHTVRIRDILAVFPEARFVMIFRDPEAVMASIYNSARSAGMVWNALQWPSSWPIEEVIDSVGSSIDAYFDAKPLIPPGNLVEVRHEDLVADEAGTLGTIYAGLGLAPPPAGQPASRGASARPYRRTAHPQLDAAVRDRLQLRCRRLHAAGWYAAGARDPRVP